MLLRDMTRARHASATCSTARTSSSCRSSTSTATSARRASAASTSAGRRRWAGAPRRTTSTSTATTPRLDAPEMRAMVGARAPGSPDLYLDLHVTDGIDYQYDITCGYNGRHAHSPGDRRAGSRRCSTPALTRGLTARRGTSPGRWSSPLDDRDPAQGLSLVWTGDAALLHRLRRRSPPADGPGREPLAEALRPARARHLRAARRRCSRRWRRDGAGLRAAIGRGPGAPRRPRCRSPGSSPPSAPPATVDFLAIALAPRAVGGLGRPARCCWTGRAARPCKLPRRRPTRSATTRPPPRRLLGAGRLERGDRAPGACTASAWSASPRRATVDGRRCTGWPTPSSPPTPFEGRVHGHRDAGARSGGARPSRPARCASPPTSRSATSPCCCSSPPRDDSFFQWGFFLPRSCSAPSTSRATSWSRWPSACWPRTRSSKAEFEAGARRRPGPRRRPAGAPAVVLPPHAVLRRALAALSGRPGGAAGQIGVRSKPGA